MRYDAFISYRHAELDMFVAKRLHKGLETFSVPKAVQKKTGKKSIKRVFRDQEELPIGSDLGDNIEQALRESEYLIVVCSPRTPESYWVQKEIAAFIEIHGREHILAVLVEGEPEESFPKQLLVDDNGKPVEPLAADVRGTSKSEVLRKLKSEIMRLAAPLLGCSYDDLKQRHKERRMKKMLGVAGGLAVFGMAFGLYSNYNSMLVQKNYEEKQVNQSKYLADTALSLLEHGDRRTATLIALEALPTEGNDRPYVAGAQYALGKCLHIYDTGNRISMDISFKHDLPVKDFSYNQDGSRLISVDQGGYVYVWDVADGTLYTKLSPEFDEESRIIFPNKVLLYQENIVIADETGIRSVNPDGSENYHIETDETENACIFLEEKGIAATVSLKKVTFVDLVSGKEIGMLENLQEEFFTSTMAFNQDGSLFAIAHLADYEAEEGLVSIYNMDSDSVQNYTVSKSYVAELAFTSDNHIVVGGYKEADLFSDEGADTIEGEVEKIDIETGEVLWKNKYEMQRYALDATSTQLKTRSYVNAETGEMANEVLLAVNNKTFTWDAMTGELVADLQLTNGIQKFLISTTGAYGYLADSAGMIHICDMTNGTTYTNATIDTGKEIRDVLIKNGVVAIRAYASPEIYLMKYQEGYGLVKLDTYESYVKDIVVSGTENYYGVCTSDTNGKEKTCFYKTEDNEYLSEWTYRGDAYVSASCFVGDVFVTIDSEGNSYFYDLNKLEESEVKAEETIFSADVYFTENGRYAFIYGGTQYRVIDLAEQKKLYEGSVPAYFYSAILSETGDKLYCNLKDMGICVMDVATNEVVPLEMRDYQMVPFSQNQDSFALNEDGTVLAVNCRDNVLRFLDLEKMETVSEIPFAGMNRCFLQFLQDGKHIMMQGDDYYIRVYDLQKQEFCAIASEQNNEIAAVIYNEKDDTLVIKTGVEMLVLSADNYEKIAEMEDGLAYIPAYEKVYCSYSGTLYQFPYMTLEMVLEEAKRRFGEDTLTAQERIKYNVD